MEKASEQKLASSIINNILDVTRVVYFSSISLEEPFMLYEPETFNQKNLKQSIIEAKETGISDFRRPLYDPSIDNDGNIVFQKGLRPATGFSADWWIEKARNIFPEKNSRIGSFLHYCAFMAVILKTLIEKFNYSIKDAWFAVCDDSKDLGNYYNFDTQKTRFEMTGSKPIDGWGDLSNTCKITLADENSNIVVASGYYCFYSYVYSLAYFMTHIRTHSKLHCSTGWIICDV